MPSEDKENVKKGKKETIPVPELLALYHEKTNAIRPNQPKPPRDRTKELNEKAYKSASPLFTASVTNGNTEYVLKELAKGADPNEIDQGGNPMLLMACINGHVEIAKTLIDAGADVTATNKKSATALHVAAKGGTRCEGCAKLLLQYDPVRKAIDAQDCEGNTALVLASKHGTTDTLKRIIDAGANIHFIVGTLSPVQLAASQGKHENEKLLRDHGCKPHKQWNAATRQYEIPKIKGIFE
eukprot:CAMPEP_0119298594 /NCGR_PEP_ID=MMETSP1333-20130426/759_1 /TAXON_ID=418940 /ORGANISM="Scyphosphaera apsteinii, Strain RCC1455" /LENGTH=239 /DNA_ID=CAMNT_0007299741 /DNA_START=27 /DNA_END=746 /DNA_ORIENTATION=+